jgi:hypothetical protein
MSDRSAPRTPAREGRDERSVAGGSPAGLVSSGIHHDRPHPNEKHRPADRPGGNTHHHPHPKEKHRPADRPGGNTHHPHPKEKHRPADRPVQVRPPAKTAGGGSAQQICIDAPALREAASAFEAAGRRLAADTATTLAKIRALGDYIGDDAIGRDFRAGYQPHEDDAVQGVNRAPLAVQRVGKLLGAAADLYQGQDCVSARAFSTIPLAPPHGAF